MYWYQSICNVDCWFVSSCKIEMTAWVAIPVGICSINHQPANSTGGCFSFLQVSTRFLLPIEMSDIYKYFPPHYVFELLLTSYLSCLRLWNPLMFSYFLQFFLWFSLAGDFNRLVLYVSVGLAKITLFIRDVHPMIFPMCNLDFLIVFVWISQCFMVFFMFFKLFLYCFLPSGKLT